MYVGLPNAKSGFQRHGRGNDPLTGESRSVDRFIGLKLASQRHRRAFLCQLNMMRHCHKRGLHLRGLLDKVKRQAVTRRSAFGCDPYIGIKFLQSNHSANHKEDLVIKLIYKLKAQLLRLNKERLIITQKLDKKLRGIRKAMNG